MKTILITLATFVFFNVAMARIGEDCKINVYKPDADREREIPAANAINKILVQKGYIIVEDHSAKLTHNATMAGFSDPGCSLSKYGMKRISAMAEIISESKTIDLQTADDVESDGLCANLDSARIKATEKLRSCSEL